METDLVLVKDAGASVVEALSRRLGEPEWLLRKRLQAWQTFLDTPLPGPRDEAWRRTPLGGVRLEGFLAFAEPTGRQAPGEDGRPAANAADGGVASAADSGVAGRAEAGLLVQRDSLVVHRQLADEAADGGVVFTDLGTAAREHPELFQRHFMTELVPPGENCFTALHAALWSGGAFLLVPAGVEVTAPLRYDLLVERSGLGVFDHVLVLAGAGSRVTLVQSLASGAPGGPALHCGVVEVVAGEGAEVRFCSLQRWSAATDSFAVRRALVGRGARVDWVAGEFGGRLARAEVQSLLYGEGCRSRTTVAYFGSGTQHLDVGAGAVHAAPGTESGIVARGAVAGRARAVYRGLGHILRGARGARMDQRQRALLLGPQARADSIPSLLIEENDVEAGHGAAAAPVDGDQLFYLMSRGLPAAAARRLLVRGFFQPLLAGLDLPALRPLLDRELEERLDALEAEAGGGGRPSSGRAAGAAGSEGGPGRGL